MVDMMGNVSQAFVDSALKLCNRRRGDCVVVCADEANCEGQNYEAPDELLEQACNTQDCPTFAFSVVWGACQAVECDGGVQRADVTCRADDGSKVPDALCGCTAPPPARFQIDAALFCQSMQQPALPVTTQASALPLLVMLAPQVAGHVAFHFSFGCDVAPAVEHPTMSTQWQAVLEMTALREMQHLRARECARAHLTWTAMPPAGAAAPGALAPSRAAEARSGAALHAPPSPALCLPPTATALRRQR